MDESESARSRTGVSSDLRASFRTAPPAAGAGDVVGSAAVRGTGSEADTRSKILTAAGPVFAASGFDGTTVREICKAAGVNVASVGYHFGDKMGLYRAVIEAIREARERRFPVPHHDQGDPRETLYLIVRTMLSRMMACDSSSWETQLMMREMNRPTPVFEQIIEQFFRPMFDRLGETIERLSPTELPRHTLEQLVLSAVGQCVYYCVGAGVIQTLIPRERRERHYDLESLARHVTSVMLSAVENDAVSQQRQALDREITAGSVSAPLCGSTTEAAKTGNAKRVDAEIETATKERFRADSC